MLNLNLLLKIKKKYKFDIGSSKKFLDINHWDYNKTIKYIENVKKNNIFINYNFYSIISFTNNYKIFIIKILFNSEIIINSKILEEFIENLSFLKINLKILKNEINFLSLKLREKIYLNKLLIFKYKNIFYYNHKNSFFCLINFKKKIINLCYNIIFNKTNFLSFYICKKNLMKQKNIQNNEIILNLLNNSSINYSILINKNGFYFFYE